MSGITTWIWRYTPSGGSLSAICAVERKINMVVLTDWLIARLTVVFRASYMRVLLIWRDLIPTLHDETRSGRVSKHQPSWRKHDKRCRESQVAQSEATAEAHPPPAYCVSPGFFIKRSTEEGRADREEVLEEGVGFHRQAQKDPLNKYMTHQQAAQYLPPPGWQFTSHFYLQYTHCRGILPPTPTVKRAQEGGEQKQGSREERSSLGSLSGKENVKDFPTPWSTSCSDETASVKRT